jgi:hypothetical protein
MKRFLFVLLTVSLALPAVADWHIETVDSNGDIVSPTSLALDSSDNPHIAYCNHDGINKDLMYAHWDGSAWQLETVASNGWFPSLALDSFGNPHISYCDFSTNDLTYSRWDGSAWQTETLELVGYYNSLVLDSSNYPHIMYQYQSGSGDLLYTHWNGSSWQTDTVDSIGAAGGFNSLMLDSSGYPHVSYYDWSNENLKYAHWDGSAWQTETVDSAGRVGTYTSLVLNSSVYPCISYYDAIEEDLKYARWDGTTWQIETVDSAGDVGMDTSLVLDSSGYPRISYYDYSNENLKYAHWNGSIWQFEAIDTAGSVGSYTSIKLDSSGISHISYWHNTNGQMKYARYESGAAVESVDLFANARDEGVLLSWSIVGDGSASVSVLRGTGSSETLHPLGELNGSATSWLDVSAEAGVEYAYYLEVTEFDGTVSRFGPSEVIVPGAVSELALSDPYPNPASDSLTVSYELTQNGTVELNIYDLSGRLVETLVSSEQTSGRHSVNWNSSVAATGVYLLRLETNGEAITKRAVISR